MDPHHELDRLDLRLGPEPPLPPLATTLAAGRRALLRRRVATGAAALAVAGVLGAGWVAGGPRLTSGAGGADPVGRPAPTTSAVPERAVDPATLRWGKREVGRYVDGELVLRPDARIHERIDDPYATGIPHDSVALDATVRGERGWFLLALVPTPEGGTHGNAMWSEPSRGWADFAAWVDDQVSVDSSTLSHEQHVPGSADIPVTLVGDVLVPLDDGVDVVEQVPSPDLPASFAPAGTPTAAGIVEVDGRRTFVLVREVEKGLVDVVDGGPPGGRTLAQLVDSARAAYDSGEGLR